MTSSEPEPLAVQQSYHLRAQPEAVFRALTEPEMLVKWLLAKAELDPRPGGEYAFENLLGTKWSGRVESYEPGRGVSYSWVGETVVVFELVPKHGGTMLMLRHAGFKGAESQRKFSQGWAYYLTNLKSVLDHGTDLRSKYDWTA